MKKATIYDVARHAGVSHQTVTRYLNGFDGIRPETRDRVRVALDELNYRPNSAARFLRSQQTNRIGILAHRLELAGPARAVAGATRAARDRGYVSDIVPVDDENVESFENALELLLDHQIAGLFATVQTEPLRAALEAVTDVPTTVMAYKETALPAEEPEGVPGRLAAEHLAELGHRRVGFVSGPLTWTSARSRQTAFRDAAERLGVEVAWYREGDWSAASGSAIAARLPENADGVTAVGVSNDSMAFGFISGLSSRGIDVPGAVSVIGMDDSPESRYFVPALSTIRVEFESEGAYAMERLLAYIEGTDPTSVPFYLPPTLERRASTVPHQHVP